MAYTKDGQDIDSLACQSADNSLPHCTAGHYRYGTTDMSRFLTYEAPFVQYLDSGYKIKGEPVPLIKRGFAPYLENGKGVFEKSKVIASLSAEAAISKVVEYTLTRKSNGDLILATYQIAFADNLAYTPKVRNPQSPDLDVDVLAGPIRFTTEDFLFYNLTSSIHSPTATETLITSNAPYLVYFELCGGGGGSGSSGMVLSSGGAGGGATITGLLDFTKNDTFWFRIGAGGLGGIANESYPEGRDGTFSAVISPTIDSANRNKINYTALVAEGGRGSTGSEAGAAGGGFWACTGSTEYTAIMNNSYTPVATTTFNSDISPYRHGSAGIYLLSHTAGGSGGAVDNPGTSVSCAADFCPSVPNFCVKTCSGAGGANTVNGEAAWGGGGGASALGNGGSGSRQAQTAVDPGYGGGGGGRGYYVLGLGVDGKPGGTGCVKLYWNNPSCYYQTPRKPEVAVFYEAYIDPATGKADPYLGSYCINVYNPTNETVKINLYWDRGTSLDYTSGSVEFNVASTRDYLYDWFTSYTGSTIDWGAKIYATATLNGITVKSDYIIYNSSAWYPPSSSSSQQD